VRSGKASCISSFYSRGVDGSIFRRLSFLFTILFGDTNFPSLSILLREAYLLPPWDGDLEEVYLLSALLSEFIDFYEGKFKEEEFYRRPLVKFFNSGSMAVIDF
jgi:hypothetical protein